MNDELKRKRKHRGFSFYPVRRKKKRLHVQFISYARVLDNWGFVPSIYYIFAIENRGWWACLPDANYFDNIEVDGDFYRPMYEIPFYDGGHGDAVYGYVGVIYHYCKAIDSGRFVFVKNPVTSAGQELSFALSIKRKINLEKFKKFEIWKTE